MSNNSFFPHLFSPMQVGGRTLRNRIVLSATLTNFGAGHRVTERWINFLAERAKGGCGAVVSEVIAVDPAALAHSAIVTGYDETNEEGFKRTAEAVEGAGACLIGQLWHPGRQQLWTPVRSPKGISDQPDAYSWTVRTLCRPTSCGMWPRPTSQSRCGSNAAALAGWNCTAHTAI